MKKLLILVVSLVLCSTLAWAANWWEEEQSASTATKQIQSFKESSGSTAKTLVNWQEGYIEAVGVATVDMAKMKNKVQAELMAQEGACTLAYAKLSESLHGVAVNANTTVANMMTDDQYARSATEGIIKGARRIEERVDKSGDAPKGICRVGIVMRGEKGVQVPAYDFAVRNKVEGSIPVFAPTTPPVESMKYTGVVIDARDVNLKPAMIPQIVTDEGKLLYGASIVDANAAKASGLAAYGASADAVASRVGSNPLIIKAAGLYGSQNAGVKISTADALKALASNISGDVLKLAKVAFLVK